VLFGLQLATPDIASDAFHEISIAVVVFSQPFAFGEGLGAGVVAGGVES
jgi:hypothetical protein